MHVVILAGGGGTRLWPLSREDFPKQFLSFGSSFSLLQRTVKRLINAPFVQEVIVATNSHHLALVQEQLKKIDAKCRILVEPARRNTAPAISLAIKMLEEELAATPDELVLIVPSDHLIEPEIIFLDALEQIIQTHSHEQKIVTFGIRPTKAETGFGYIEIGKKCNAMMYQTNRFVEKPDQINAEKYLNNSLFFWNSGIFLFSIQTFWEELRMHCPSMNELFNLDRKMLLDRFYELPNLSIDYAIMEKSKSILLCPLPVFWSDIGSWDCVYDLMEKDQNQNVKIGQVLAVDTKNSLIFGGRRTISTIGLENLLIVETENGVLISKKGESQKVKELIEQFQRHQKKTTEPGFNGDLLDV